MTKRKIAILMICRAAVIAALYVTLTMPFGQLAYGPFQIRPAEALCVLPLFYPEAIGGLYVGCFLSNLLSGYGAADYVFGSLATLAAAAVTYLVGIIIKNKPAKVIIGCIPPVVFNMFVVPLIWYIAGTDLGYWANVGIMALNETIWVYALGIPLFFVFDRLIKNGTKGIMPYHIKVKNDIQDKKISEN